MDLVEGAGMNIPQCFPPLVVCKARLAGATGTVRVCRAIAGCGGSSSCDKISLASCCGAFLSSVTARHGSRLSTGELRATQACLG